MWLAYIVAIDIDRFLLVLFVEQSIGGLQIVDGSIGNHLFGNHFALGIGLDVVLVHKIVDLVLLCPMGIGVYLIFAVWVSFPELKAVFDPTFIK